LNVPEEARNEWYRHWVVEGLTALERSLTPATGTGTFCHGDTPTLADICLVPQVYNAERADIDLSPFPRIMKIVAACRELRAFQDADPAKQPDAE
jgi:maleylpyruvate isomerase